MPNSVSPSSIPSAPRSATTTAGSRICGLRDVLGLASHFTVQQFLARDNFRRRIATGDPIGLGEFLYALLQGQDAVVVRADVQLGATEQLFNLRAGAKLQEAVGQAPCIAITYPILVGTDGKERMSKSKGNYVGIAEDADTQFGKVMSIPDETMLAWAPLVTGWEPDRVASFIASVRSGAQHPMQAKKLLAWTVVATYHNAAEADRARDQFEAVQQRRERPQEMSEFETAGPYPVVQLLTDLGLAKSRSAERRIISAGAVSLDGVAVQDVEATVRQGILRVGKRHFVRVRAQGE